MKKRVFRFVICLVLLSFVFGCRLWLSNASQTGGVFRIVDGKLTDGVSGYRRLPDNWSYNGKYPYKIGTVKGGNSLYASDENGTIVREAKPWYADMEYAPWVLDRIEIPETPDADSSIRVTIFRDRAFYLSSKAAEEFMAWYSLYLDGQADRFGTTYEQPFASVSFESSAIQGLFYYAGYCFVQREDGIGVTDDTDKMIGFFSSDSFVYQEVCAKHRD